MPDIYGYEYGIDSYPADRIRGTTTRTLLVPLTSLVVSLELYVGSVLNYLCENYFAKVYMFF